MIYIFGIMVIYTFFKQRKSLFMLKRNLILFLLLSAAGIILGIVHLASPYIPSVALIAEKYMK